MHNKASIQIALGLVIAGSVCFSSQVLFQEFIAVVFGTNTIEIAISIAISLLGASIGAQFSKILFLSPPQF
jgi:hypothetical protein